MNARFVALLVVVASVVSGPLRAETADQWVAKARAYLGSESALGAVETIRFSGTLETRGTGPAAADKSQPESGLEQLPIEIIFQKPYCQRMTVTRPASVDTVALDDYEAWSKTTGRENPAASQVTLLDAQEIRQLRANTWENLNFFAGIEKKGGTVELAGDVIVDGIACAKLSFIHSNRIVFHRYFDKATGRLVKTETANGSEIREEGEVVVNGVRFPRKVINRNATGQVATIIFDSIVLNERVPPGEFAVPSLSVL